LLESWQREILRIVRKVSQYFYPQKQTQVMNEGWATFWHYTILNHLYDEGKVTERFMLEFLHSHTNVVFQPPYNSPWYSGINPYALGFAMFQDIKRICQSPTEEDKYWFPDIAGSDWLETLHFAMRDFKDESFISQFLSPKVMRDFRFFTVLDDDRHNYLEFRHPVYLCQINIQQVERPVGSIAQTCGVLIHRIDRRHTRTRLKSGRAACG
ncbi:SpoVR family protein, partial [Escherichia sp. SS-MK2]